MKLNVLAQIFMVTLRIGAFTFGGGYAMIPLMQDEFVDKRHWIEEKDIIDVFAVAQSLPGVIAVNSSLLIGYKIAGICGGLVAALGVVLPSFVILSIVTLFYQAFITNAYVAGALRGISAAVVALMLSAVLRLKKQSVNDAWTWGLAVIALVIALFFSKINVVYLIVAGGVAGLLIKASSLGAPAKKAGKL